MPTQARVVLCLLSDAASMVWFFFPLDLSWNTGEQNDLDEMGSIVLHDDDHYDDACYSSNLIKGTQND